MSVTIKSNIQTPQVGQKVRIDVEDTLAPAHLIYTGGNPTTTDRGFSIEGVSSDTDNLMTLFQTSQTYLHHITHAAVLDGAGGSFEYTIGNTWQSKLREGGDLSIVLKNFAGVEAVRIKFVQYSFPGIEISTHAGVQQTTYDTLVNWWPIGTKVRVEYKTDIRVFLNNALIWQGAQNFSIGWPLKLTYEYQAVVGSPADSAGLVEPVRFDEIKLIGGWYSYLPPAHAAAGGTWNIVFHNAAHAQVGTSILHTPNWQQGSGPYTEFIVPALPVGATHIKIFHTIQPGRSHGTTSLELTLHTGTVEPPLAISGPNPIELEPGASFDVQVPGYTPLDLTYEVIEPSGGSFGSGATINRYTAPTAQGTYTIRVTQGARQVTKSVFVKPRLFIGGVPITTVAMIGGTAKTITTNFNVPSFATTGWTSTGPVLTSKAATSVVATAPNSTATYFIIAQTGLAAPWGEVQIGVNVTSTGSIPTGGLRLLPAEGVNGSVNLQITAMLTAETDATIVVWASVSNARIDGSNNNLIIQQNIGEVQALLANCFNAPGGGTLVWQFNSSNVPDSIDADHVYGWRVEDRNGHILAHFTFEYQNSGTTYLARLRGEDGTTIASQTFTATATTLMSIASTDGANFTFAFREDTGASWTFLGGLVAVAGIQARFQYQPSIRSRGDNTVIVAKPTLSSGWGRWVRPNWFAEVLDISGNVIGAYPTVASESNLIINGNRPQVLLVTLNQVSTGRVRAIYPSGAQPVNNVAINVAPAAGGAALAWSSPTFPLDVSPGQEITLVTNYSNSEVIFTEINGKGTFGFAANNNKWTAPTFAGTYTIKAQKGGEVLTGIIKVKPTLTPASQSVQASGGGNTRSITYSLNTNEGEIQVGVTTGGTTILSKNSDGTSNVAFIAGPSAGGPFTIAVVTQFGTATATVTITSATVPPIVISSPSTNTIVDPQSTTPYVDIITNYSGNTVFTATGGTFGTGAQANRWFAPSTAGTYAVTATGPTGSGTPQTINLKVPLRITPPTLSPMSPNTSVQLAANISPIIEWRLSGDGQWGTLTSSLSPTTTLTVKDVDGNYTVTLRALLAGVEQTIVLPVTVLGVPLEVTGGLQITVEPIIAGTSFSGGTYRVLTNKTLSDTNLTFTCESGNGGFGAGADKNLYTAPSDAGNYQFFVQYLGQKKTIAVRVPARIAPASASLTAVSGAQSFATNSNVVSPSTTGWAATGGALTSRATRSVTYTAAAVAGPFSVTAITIEGTTSAGVQISLSGPALAVTSGLAITLNSRSTHQIVANYAPSDGVTYVATTANIEVSASGLVTGPLIAGVYTIEVRKSGHTTQVVTITVPLTISPSAQTVVPGQALRFSVNYPTVAFSASAGAGTINALSGDYIAASIPGGPFTITASTLVGTVTATINISQVDLIISGPDVITLEPGATHEVKANFPTAMLVYTVISGGSFNGNIYTAPVQMGQYRFRVSVLSGSAFKEITVNVPLRISPVTWSMGPGESKQFIANAPQAQWSLISDYPGVVGTVSATGFYQSHVDAPPIVRLTVSVSGESDTATVSFLTEYAYQASYPLDGELNREVSLTRTEDGARWGTALGDAKRSFELRFLNREIAEYEAASAHWRDYYPDKAFIYYHRDTDEKIPVQYDSRFTEEWQGPCEVNYAFRIVEV